MNMSEASNVKAFELNVARMELTSTGFKRGGYSAKYDCKVPITPSCSSGTTRIMQIKTYSVLSPWYYRGISWKSTRDP